MDNEGSIMKDLNNTISELKKLHEDRERLLAMIKEERQQNPKNVEGAPEIDVNREPDF